MMTSTAKPDYWALLGLIPDSSPEQLKRAFRKEARKWHPDLNSNNRKAEERFKLVNEAYAVLSDPIKRSNWEKELQTTRITEDPFITGFPTFENYLSVILGIENSQIEIDNQDVSYNDSYTSGNVYSESLLNDQDIDGDYDVKSTSQSIDFTNSCSEQPVLVLDDLESIIDLNPEQALYGTNVQLELDNGAVVEVNTPPFAGHGWRLRLEGVAPGGRDHFLQLRVSTQEGLIVDGLRVLYKLELFPPEAALGCSVEVPTLDGPVTLQVPPKSSSGRLLRLRGRGLEYENIKGDQYVEIVIVLPSDLTESEIALYQRLQELSIDPDAI